MRSTSPIFRQAVTLCRMSNMEQTNMGFVETLQYKTCRMCHLRLNEEYTVKNIYFQKLMHFIKNWFCAPETLRQI